MSQYAVIIHVLHPTLAQRATFAGNMPYFINMQILSFAKKTVGFKFYFKNNINFEH